MGRAAGGPGTTTAAGSPSLHGKALAYVHGRAQHPIRHHVGPLAGLRRAGDIGDGHVAAAERWYRDWVMGVEGVDDARRPSSGKAGECHARMLARIKASGRCAAVRHALGASAERRLRMTMVDELSFCEIARRLMPGDTNGRKKIAAQTALLLEMLAEHYQRYEGENTARGAQVVIFK